MPSQKLRPVQKSAPGLKYRFPLPIDFKLCREEIAGAYNNFVIAGVNESMLSLLP